MTTPNNTSTGGILQPIPQPPTLVTNPPNLTFIDFLQTVLVGLSNLPGTMVRPDWQLNPPKRPDVRTNWIAFGIDGIEPDFNAYVGFDSNENPIMQRNELIGLVVNVYGPNAYDNYGLLRDGFQLTQNLTALKTAKVGFAYDTPAQHVPDLINEIWYERWRTVFYLRRQILRSYPILTFVSASGTIYANTQGNDTVVLPVASGER